MGRQVHWLDFSRTGTLVRIHVDRQNGDRIHADRYTVHVGNIHVGRQVHWLDFSWTGTLGRIHVDRQSGDRIHADRYSVVRIHADRASG